MTTFSSRIDRGSRLVRAIGVAGRRSRLVRAIGVAGLSGALAACQLGELLHSPDPGPPASGPPSPGPATPPTTPPATPPTAPPTSPPTSPPNSPPATPPTSTPPVARASRLQLLGAPSVVVAGVPLATVVVRALTITGDVDTTFTGTVEIGLVNAAGAALYGTRVLSAVRGVAEFSHLMLQRAGSGYRLASQSNGMSGAQSAAFDVVPGAATALRFAVQPAGQALAAVITPEVQVTVIDQYANVVTSYAGSVTMALGASPTLGLGQLRGTRTVNVVGGRAKFRDLSIDLPGLGYTLVARAGTLSAESAPFNVGL